jgi:iron complex transport system substrate-binding protein
MRSMLELRRTSFPSRIVCLTGETTETLYLLGEDWRIVGISGFTVRPPRARREKPKVSGFTNARIERIIELKPDLILAFSDLQADIAADLARAGLSVHVFNQRDVPGILQMVRTLGALIGCEDKAAIVCDQLIEHLEKIRGAASRLGQRPRIYFEEWNDPLISGIRWVSQLIEMAGGEDCFAELGSCPLAKDRIIADPLEVVRRAPDIIIASWCGKRFNSKLVRARAGWDAIPAVKADQLFEIKAPLILQPGPAALTEGVSELLRIVTQWQARAVRSA